MKKDTKYLIIAILINIGIFGGIALAIVGAVTNHLWLVYTAFGFIGFMGVVCIIFPIIVSFKFASEEDKKQAKEKLQNAKSTFKNMNKRERINFILLTTLIVSLFISIIILSVFKLYIAMFICIGCFVGIGFVPVIIHYFKNFKKKIMNNRKTKK